MIFLFSGKKQSGKSTSCYYIFNKFQERREDFGIKKQWCVIKDNGEIDSDIPEYHEKNIEQHKYELDSFFKEAGCKIYSFADYLKRHICVNLLGLEPICIYGDNRLKSVNTHIYWESMPLEIQNQFRRHNLKNERAQPMTHRQVMEVIGTGIFRAMDPHCWARATYSLIEAEKDFYPLALISDARFPNEVTMGTELNGVSIRLKRDPFPDDPKPEPETALDDFPEGEFTEIINNQNMSQKEKDYELGKIFNKYVTRFK